MLKPILEEHHVAWRQNTLNDDSTVSWQQQVADFWDQLGDGQRTQELPVLLDWIRAVELERRDLSDGPKLIRWCIFFEHDPIAHQALWKLENEFAALDEQSLFQRLHVKDADSAQFFLIDMVLRKLESTQDLYPQLVEEVGIFGSKPFLKFQI